MSNVIVITGVGKRLGHALACHFLAKGDRVVGTFRTEHPQTQALFEQGADLYQVDFYQQQQVECFIQAVKKEYRTVRAIIHNASDWLPDNASLSALELDPAQIFQKMMTIHAGIPYQLNLAFRELLVSGDSAAADIIHVTDFVAEKGSKKHIAYAASKAALENMTLSFASLLAPEVKVNGIAPAMLKFNQQDADAYKEKALVKALIPVEAGFNEVIHAVDFVMASRFFTGRTLKLDGGRHLK